MSRVNDKLCSKMAYIRMMLDSKINKETPMIPMTTKELLTQGAGKSKRR